MNKVIVKSSASLPRRAAFDEQARPLALHIHQSHRLTGRQVLGSAFSSGAKAFVVDDHRDGQASPATISAGRSRGQRGQQRKERVAEVHATLINTLR